MKRALSQRPFFCVVVVEGAWPQAMTAWSQDSDEPVIEAIGLNDPYDQRWA
jgi:hypothetical protein